MKCPVEGCNAVVVGDTPEKEEKAMKIHIGFYHKKGMASGACPECGATLFHDSGCLLCQSCGWSKC